MNILGSNVIARAESLVRGATRCWLALHELSCETDGKQHKYFMVTRGDQIVPHDQKKPDAVCVIGFDYSGPEPVIILTKEYRVAIGAYEIGAVAGLIDAADYEIPDHFSSSGVREGLVNSVEAAAKKAAIREFHEETGLTFEPVEISAENLYSTAGMTNESVCLVIGKASGTSSRDHLEEGEDIHTIPCNRQQVCDLLEDKKLAFSKHVWPFLWAIKHFGFPSI